MKAHRVEFTPPEGSVPSGTAAGEEFDLVCTFRVKGDGTVCLVVFGEDEMPGYSDRPEPKRSMGYGKEAGDMVETVRKQRGMPMEE